MPLVRVRREAQVLALLLLLGRHQLLLHVAREVHLYAHFLLLVVPFPPSERGLGLVQGLLSQSCSSRSASQGLFLAPCKTVSLTSVGRRLLQLLQVHFEVVPDPLGTVLEMVLLRLRTLLEGIGRVPLLRTGTLFRSACLGLKLRVTHPIKVKFTVAAPLSFSAAFILLLSRWFFRILLD